MNKRIKVIQISPEYNVKSIDVSDLAEQIIKGLPKDQFEVTSAYLSGSPRANQPVSIAEHHHYFNFSENSMRGLRVPVLWKLYRHLINNHYDVVICNRFKTVSLMLQLNKLLKIPLCIGISHVLNEYNRRYRRMQVRLLGDTHWQFVGVSDAVTKTLIEYRSGFTAENTQTVANAIDIAKAESYQMNKDAARQALGLPEGVRIIGTIGQLFKRKGHRYIIAALAEIHAQYPNAHIAIIGKGPEEQNLREQIRMSGLEKHVHLLGFRENALQYVKAFDIWAMPSLKEGLPLALMEGMSGRLPVLGSDIPEMHDIIKNSGGILVKPADTEGFSNALKTLLDCGQTALINKSEESFRFLSNHHSIEVYRENYRELIIKKLLQVQKK